MPKRLAWERQEDETPKAHAAFRVYLELGAGRTVAATAEKIRASVVNTERWHRNHDWKSRALAFDQHTERVAQAARDRVTATTAAEWERRRLADLESIYQGGLKMRARGLNMLDYPLTTKKTTETEVSADDKTIIHHNTIKPANWTFATAGSLVEKSAAITTTAIDAALAEDDAFDPMNATPEECQAWLSRFFARKKAAQQAAGVIE